MGFVDLHVHSNASDGTLSPCNVVSLAVEKKLEAIALTDHDTIAGIREAMEAADRLPLEVIPGIELSCVYLGAEIHILGLYVNPEDPNFIKETEKLLAIREKRNTEMISRFSKAGIQFTREELTAGNPDTVITRAHFARALVEKGVSATMNAAFRDYLSYGGPYCPHKERIEPERAVRLLRDCGAFPVLAHPCQYKLGDNGTESLVVRLKEAGLAGLEVYHSSNNQYESANLLRLAKKHGLLPTGGSDFHGTNKPDIDLGTGRGGLRILSLLLDDIKERMRSKA